MQMPMQGTQLPTVHNPEHHHTKSNSLKHMESLRRARKASGFPKSTSQLIASENDDTLKKNPNLNSAKSELP